MTFVEYVANQNPSIRVFNSIHHYRITEYTPHSQIIQCRTVGKHSAMDIEQLQQDYIKTFDVAYQQVIQYIRRDVRY